MITPTTNDKSKYVEAIKLDSDAETSYERELPNIRSSYDYRNRLVKSHWRYVRDELKKNENPRTLVETGDLYLLKDNHKKAVEYYLRALKIDANYIAAYQKVIQAYSLYNRHIEADVYFKKLITLTEGRVEILRDYASFKLFSFIKGAGNIKDVLNVIERVILQNPLDFEMLNTYGFVVLNFNKDLALAKVYFEKALSVNKTYIHSLNNLGACYLREGNMTIAKEKLKLCIEVDPYTYAHGYQNLALVYLKEDNNLKAYETLSQGLKNKAPIETHWDHLIGWLLIQLNRYVEAKIWYIAKIKQEPENDLLLNNLGFCYRALNEIEKAKKCFTNAVNILESRIKRKKFVDARSLKAYYNLGRLAIDDKDGKTVREVADKIFRVNSQDAFGFYLDGSADNIKTKYDQAKASYKKALEINPLISEVYPDYAFVLECIDHQYEEAIKLLTRAIDLGLGSTLIDNNLAYAYISLGNLKAAEKILKKYEKQPDDAITATRGMLEIRKGNLSEGNSLYKKAISNFDKQTRKIATQMQYLENARFYFDRKNFDKTKEYIYKAQAEYNSYLDKDIKELQLKLEMF